MKNVDEIKRIAAQDPERAYRAAGYGGKFRRSGNNLVGLCELHADSNPSFTVFDDGGFKCFGCEASGSVIDFYIAKHGIGDFHTACEELTEALCVGGSYRTSRSLKPREVGRHRYACINDQGECIAEHLRIDYADGTKKVWWERNGQPGLQGMPTTELPLYRLQDLLGAPEGVIVIVCEGEKATDALTAHGFVAVGTVCGASTTPSKQVLKPLINHDVVLWPDNDIQGQQHMQRVGDCLIDMGATVRMLEWTEAPAKGDAHDFFEQSRDEKELGALIDAACLPDEWVANQEKRDDERRSKKNASVPQLAEAILETHHFAVDTGGRLYVYVQGAFRDYGLRQIKTSVKRLLREWNISEKWSSHKQNEVAEYIRVDAPELWTRPPLNVVNLANGLLDLETGKFEEHSPKFLSPIQLPVQYQPGVDCPSWRKFVTTTFPSDTVELPWQIAAWLMTPDTNIQKAVLLLGDGSNGKSTFLSALTAFLGKPNCSALSLQKLETDRFAAARLVGRLANICPDLPSTHLAETSVFKALIGGDRILGERKYADSFEFEPFARLILSANHPPRSNDASDAFFRRWLCVPFTRTFSGSDARPRQELDTELADPRELSGVLNMALEALPTVRAQGIIETPTMQEAMGEFRMATDPLSVWLAQEVEYGPELVTPKKTMHAAYNAHLERMGRPVVTANAFGRSLRQVLHDLQEAQRMHAGQLQWCWLGIGLKAGRGDSS